MCRTHDSWHVFLFTELLGSGVSVLLNEATRFKSAAYANTTKRTYQSQTNSYIKFCLKFNLIPVPASQETICAYVSFLARTLSPNSIPAYMNIIRILHIEAGFNNPISDNWELKMIQKGISRLLGKPPKQKLPISIPILLGIASSLANHPSDASFWAACLVAFFGFLRKSTLLPANDAILLGKFISRRDLEKLTLASFSIRIRNSKTIQFGQRVLVLPYVSCADPRLCPVRAMLKHLGHSKLPEARPLFNYMDKGVEFQFTHAFFVKRLKLALLASGNSTSEISCHSFRRGGATLAHAVGLSSLEIKCRGDWRSNAFERYVDISASSSLSSAHALSVGAVAAASCYVFR